MSHSSFLTPKSRRIATFRRRGYRVRPHTRRLKSGKKVRVGGVKKKTQGGDSGGFTPPSEDAIDKNIERVERVANAASTLASSADRLHRISTRAEAIKLRRESLGHQRTMGAVRTANILHGIYARRQRLDWRDQDRQRIYTGQRRLGQ